MYYNHPLTAQTTSLPSSYLGQIRQGSCVKDMVEETKAVQEGAEFRLRLQAAQNVSKRHAVKARPVSA